MTLSLVACLSDPLACACGCHDSLSDEQRVADVRAIYRFDDAMRGWGYQPLYDPRAHALWREAQAKNDPAYRAVAVRDHACLHRRLVGFAVHELIHALCGDVSQANYGIQFGLPYGVPETVAPADERAYLHPFNQAEARAFVGVGPMARALWGIDWAVYTARDVGTYGFPGGNAIVPVPAGFRAVSHVDRQIQPERYYALARRLEDEARAWFTPARIAELVGRVEEAEVRGRATRGEPYPPAETLGRLRPRKLGRNDLCPCGTGKKVKACCGA